MRKKKLYLSTQHALCSLRGRKGKGYSFVAREKHGRRENIDSFCVVAVRSRSRNYVLFRAEHNERKRRKKRKKYREENRGKGVRSKEEEVICPK